MVIYDTIAPKRGVRMATSKAQLRATRKYEAENYDLIRVRLPKGSKDVILANGETVNGLLNKAFKEYCENHNIK